MITEIAVIAVVAIFEVVSSVVVAVAELAGV